MSAPYQRQDSTIFGANPQTTNAPQSLGGSQLIDWGKGWLEGVVGVLNPANIPAALNSTLQAITDPKGWASDQQQGMDYVFYQAQHGDFGPAGKVEGAQAGSAALGLALQYSVLRWEGVGSTRDITSGGTLPPNGSGGRSAVTDGWAVDAEAGGWSQYDQYRLSSGNWDWPAANGALPSTTTNYTLEAGVVIDRIGSTRGYYLSPIGTPLTNRAMAPGSFAETYSQYVVLKPFVVEKSGVAPAFGEAGNGIQYKIPEVPSGKKVTVEDLIKNGYLGEKK